MPKGLTVPVMPGQSGGAQIQEDPNHLDSILRLALAEGGDDNPFQRLGLDRSIIFRINDPSARGVAKRSVEAIVRKFSDRIALDPSQPVSFSRTKEGELLVSFRYVDLTTNEATDFSAVIGG